MDRLLQDPTLGSLDHSSVEAGAEEGSHVVPSPTEDDTAELTSDLVTPPGDVISDIQPTDDIGQRRQHLEADEPRAGGSYKLCQSHCSCSFDVTPLGSSLFGGGSGVTDMPYGLLYWL